MKLLRSLAIGPLLAACSASPSTPPADAAATADLQAIADVPASTDVASQDVSRADVQHGVDVPASTDVAVVDAPDTPGAPDVPAATDACARPDVVRLTSRVECGARSDGAACPVGYECMSFAGVVLQQFCGRACVADCDCPSGERCGSYTDKAGTHPLCVDAAR